MTTNDPKDLEEVWASTTGGVVWVHKKDPLRPGNWVEKFIGGPGNVKLRLTVEEREHNEELVAYDNDHLNPFKNGLLVRVDVPSDKRGRFEVTDEELITLFNAGENDEFLATIEQIPSEVLLRRMLKLATNDPDARASRLKALSDLIHERYPNGWATDFIKEVLEKERPLRRLQRI